MQKHWREIWLVVLATAVILAAFFYPAVFQDRLVYSGDFTGSDLLELNLPRRVLAAQAVSQGEWPLWEPRLGNGLPLLAEGQAGVFYPTTLPLYLLLSPTAATNYSILLTLGIAVLGGYLLARTYGASPMSAFFCALAYGLGGAFVFRLKHLNMIQVSAWLPCSLALIRLYWRSWKLIYLLILAAVWSLQFLAGHPHVTYICWLTCYLYAFALVFETKDSGDRTGRRRWFRLLTMMFIGTVGALVLSSVQLLPTLDLVRNSNRAAAKSWEEQQQYPFGPANIWRLVRPYSSGNPAEGTYTYEINSQGVFWESTPYVGIVPLLLSFVCIFTSRRRTVYILFGLALLFFLSSLGCRGGVYWLFWKFCPGFDLFRFPARFLISFQCFAALLAALGAQSLYEILELRWGSRAAGMALGGMLFLTVCDLFCINNSYQAYLPRDWEQQPLSWSYLQNDAQRVYAPTNFQSAWDVLRGGWRGRSAKIIYHNRVLPPDLSALWGVNCHSDRVVFEGGVVLAPYYTLQVCENSDAADAVEQYRPMVFGDYIYDLLRMQNVSHILTFFPIADADSKPQIADKRVMGDPLFLDNPLYIYALRDPLPLFRLIAAYEVADDVPAIIKSVQERFLLRSIPSLYERRMGLSRKLGTVRFVQKKRSLWQVEAVCPEKCFLFAAINCDDNWQAYEEDGTRVPIVRFNHAYQAIALEPGKHLVTLEYHSDAFDWGCIISLSAWLGLLAWALYLGKYR